MHERRCLLLPACETCFNDLNVTHPLCEYGAVNSPVLVSYCRHHQTGGFIQMDLEEERWTMFWPVHESAWRWFIEEAICRVIEEDSMHLFDGVPARNTRAIAPGHHG